MKSMVRIVMGDPAKKSDPTGIVGILGNCETGQVKVKLAKEITDKNPAVRIANTVKFLRWVKSNVNPDFLGMETNNDGARIISRIKKHGIIINGIATSAGLTEATRHKGLTMDKPYTVKYLAQMKDDGDILFPANTTLDMKKLIDQMSQIVGIRQATGHISYKAQRGRHDDLFMGLLLCIHVFLIYERKWQASL